MFHDWIKMNEYASWTIQLWCTVHWESQAVFCRLADLPDCYHDSDNEWINCVDVDNRKEGDYDYDLITRLAYSPFIISCFLLSQ